MRSAATFAGAVGSRLGASESDRGVSETLGFVLVFAIIILSVGAVYAVGMAGLQDARDAERVNNAERAFDVFADNVGDVVTGDAPSRATEVKLADARVYAGDPVTVNVSGTTARGKFGFEYELAPVVYDAGDDTRLVYAGGAVFRTEREGGVVVADPPLILDSSGVVFPIVQTRTRSRSIGGSATILLRARAADREILLGRQDGGHNVTVNVSSPRADLWRRTLSARPDVTCPEENNTETLASCVVTDADRVYVTVTRIDVAFER